MEADYRVERILTTDVEDERDLRELRQFTGNNYDWTMDTRLSMYEVASDHRYRQLAARPGFVMTEPDDDDASSFEAVMVAPTLDRPFHVDMGG